MIIYIYKLINNICFQMSLKTGYSVKAVIYLDMGNNEPQDLGYPIQTNSWPFGKPPMLCQFSKKQLHWLVIYIYAPSCIFRLNRFKSFMSNPHGHFAALPYQLLDESSRSPRQDPILSSQLPSQAWGIGLVGTEKVFPFGGFLKWGAPIAGWFISWKIQAKNRWFGGTPIFGNHNLMVFHLTGPNQNLWQKFLMDFLIDNFGRWFSPGMGQNLLLLYLVQYQLLIWGWINTH